MPPKTKQAQDDKKLNSNVDPQFWDKNFNVDNIPPDIFTQLQTLSYNDASALLSPQMKAGKVDVESDAKLKQSLLVAGIQPDRWVGNFLARNWYKGSLGGPKTEGNGKLYLSYDDIDERSEDETRATLYSQYASHGFATNAKDQEEVTWTVVQERDQAGAAHILNLVGMFPGIAKDGGVIYAHSGGGAATMAALRYMLEFGVSFGEAKLVQVEGLEAVITTEQVDYLVAGYEGLGVVLTVANTVADKANTEAKLGSETWHDLICGNIRDNGETPFVTHKFDNIKGDHTGMVPDLYKSGAMPDRSPVEK